MHAAVVRFVRVLIHPGSKYDFYCSTAQKNIIYSICPGLSGLLINTHDSTIALPGADISGLRNSLCGLSLFTSLWLSNKAEMLRKCCKVSNRGWKNRLLNAPLKHAKERGHVSFTLWGMEMLLFAVWKSQKCSGCRWNLIISSSFRSEDWRCCRGAMIVNVRGEVGRWCDDKSWIHPHSRGAKCRN